jgi:hypothetical protein
MITLGPDVAFLEIISKHPLNHKTVVTGSAAFYSILK